METDRTRQQFDGDAGWETASDGFGWWKTDDDDRGGRGMYEYKGL